VATALRLLTGGLAEHQILSEYPDLDRRIFESGAVRSANRHWNVRIRGGGIDYAIQRGSRR
jgi:hypothetical protein